MADALVVSEAAAEVDAAAELDVADDDESDPLSSLPQPTAAVPTSSAAANRPTVVVRVIFIEVLSWRQRSLPALTSTLTRA